MAVFQSNADVTSANAVNDITAEIDWTAESLGSVAAGSYVDSQVGFTHTATLGTGFTAEVIAAGLEFAVVSSSGVVEGSIGTDLYAAAAVLGYSIDPAKSRVDVIYILDSWAKPGDTFNWIEARYTILGTAGTATGRFGWGGGSDRRQDTSATGFSTSIVNYSTGIPSSGVLGSRFQGASMGCRYQDGLSTIPEVYTDLSLFDTTNGTEPVQGPVTPTSGFRTPVTGWSSSMHTFAASGGITMNLVIRKTIYRFYNVDPL
jgi:hypothetical protein